MSIQKAIRRLPGVKLKHHKNTADMETVRMPAPKQVTIVMTQHLGVPCIPLVKVGDEVKLGQKIGENRDQLSAPIYSSVSGKVIALKDYTTFGGNSVPSVVIESDGLQTVSETVKPPVIRTKEDFIQAVYENGMVGLGGAGFPTHTKLSFEEGKVDTLIINGAECEPYITSDNRELIENASAIVKGIQQIQTYLGIKKVIIGIEDNKKQALQLMGQLTDSIPEIQVMSLTSQYPQGAEKVLIYVTTGRVVKEGQLPADVGVIVMNVTSISKLGRYLETGMPLTAKRLTVDGDCIANPQNVRVPIGTSIQDVIDFCGGFTKEPKKIICGGPMMGVAIEDLSTPIIKNNNAILAFSKSMAELPETTACIRCGKCSQVCPVRLMPRSLEIAYDAGNAEALQKLSVNLCINCGCCSYICPAKRNLAQKNQLAKELVKKATKK